MCGRVHLQSVADPTMDLVLEEAVVVTDHDVVAAIGTQRCKRTVRRSWDHGPYSFPFGPVLILIVPHRSPPHPRASPARHFGAWDAIFMSTSWPTFMSEHLSSTTTTTTTTVADNDLDIPLPPV